MYVMTLNIAGYMVLVVQRLVNVKLEGIRKEVLSSNWGIKLAISWRDWAEIWLAQLKFDPGSTSV